jgi:hypothetical protein
MKIKANGIAMNYQVDGADGAPWLIFSNSLATNLTMWDDQARELNRRRTASCDTISAGTAAPRRPPVATASSC